MIDITGTLAAQILAAEVELSLDMIELAIGDLKMLAGGVVLHRYISGDDGSGIPPLHPAELGMIIASSGAPIKLPSNHPGSGRTLLRTAAAIVVLQKMADIMRKAGAEE